MLTNIFSQDVLKEEILETLRDVPELKNYFTENDTPILSLFASQLASILSKKAYYFNAIKNENFLQTAQQPDNKYYLAKSFGYRINRYGAPKIRMKYQDLNSGEKPKSLPLSFGDVVGSIGEFEIIYIGEDILAERGDILEFAIGKSKKYSNSFVFDDDETLVTLNIFPESLKSVDNEEIKLFVNGELKKLSNDLENFIIKKAPVDFSDSNIATKLYIHEYSSLYGLKVTPEDKYEVKWVETDGKIEQFDQSTIVLLEDRQFSFIEVMSLGHECDSLEKLSYLPIFYYKTMRRAVTDDDYKYILLQYPLLKSLNIYSKDVNNKFIFYIHNDTNNEKIVKLTEYEAEKLSKFINNYKMSGTNIYFTPAKPIDMKFDISLKIEDASKLSIVRDKITKLVHNKTLTFGAKVDVGELLAEISKIEIDGTKIINYIFPSDMPKEYNLKKYEYLVIKEENLNIEFK